MRNKNVTPIEQYVINIVREKREKAGITQAVLSHILGVSAGFIGKVESAKYPSKYNLNHINRLSKHFKCSPQSFLPKRTLKDD